MSYRIGLAAAATFVWVCIVMAAPASALTTTYKFYRGGTGYTGPYATVPVGTSLYSATAGSATNCPNGLATCTSDVYAQVETFGPGLTATAANSSTGGVAYVWDDLAPNFGGLGVGLNSSATPSDADQIAGLDQLILTFLGPVTLTSVATLFDNAHTDFGAGYATPGAVAATADTNVFKLTVDGVAHIINMQQANTVGGLLGLALTGTVFVFEQITGNPTFYVSALQVESCGPIGTECVPPPPVPIPAAFPLFLTALGLVGVTTRRRRRLTPD